MSRKLAISTALLTLIMSGNLARAGVLEIPQGPSDETVAGFSDLHPDEGVLVLQEWTGMDVRYQANDGGLSGRWVEVKEYLVQDRGDLEDVSFLTTYQSPAQRLEKFQVEIIRDGRTTKFKRKDLVWQEYTARTDGVVTLDGTNSWAMVPGVMVGDRLRTLEEYELKGLSGLPPLELGSKKWPYLVSEMELVLPEGYTMSWGGVSGGRGREHLVLSTDSFRGKQIIRWRLAAEQDGSLAQCKEEYPNFRVVSHIMHAGRFHKEDISIGENWSSVGEALLDRIDDVFEADEEISRLAAGLTEGVDDKLEKIDLIYSEVQQRCRYLGLFEGAGGIIPVPAAEVLESGFGDCKGLATLLISLLRESGFTAHPVLVRTSSAGGLDPEIPNLAQFNHFIAWVDTGDGGIFLDGTVEFCPAGLVPAADAQSEVLLLERGAIRMTDIPMESWFSGSSDRRMSGKICSDGRLELDCEYRVSGNLGVAWRDYLAGKDGRERLERLKVELLPEGLSLDAGEPLIEGMGEWRDPLILKLSVASRKPLPGTGAGFFLPRQLGGTILQFNPNLNCETPVDLRRRPARRESWSIELPDSLRLAGPDSLSVNEQGMEWESRVWQEESTLRLERSLRFTEEFMDPEDAEKLEELVAEAARRDLGYFELIRREGKPR